MKLQELSRWVSDNLLEQVIDGKALFHAALALPVIAITVKLHGWSESAMFFDGSSMGTCDRI